MKNKSSELRWLTLSKTRQSSMRMLLLFLIALFAYADGMAQNHTLRLNEATLTNHTDNNEGESVIVEFPGANNETHLVLRGALNTTTNNIDIMATTYDLNGTMVSQQAYASTNTDLVPNGACYNSASNNWLVYGNILNDDPWYIVLDNALTATASGRFVTPGGGGLLTLTDAVAVNGQAGVDYAFVARKSTNTANLSDLFGAGTSLVIFEFLSTAATYVSFADITNFPVGVGFPSTTYDLHANGFGTSIIEIDAGSANDGYFITGRVNDAAFYLRSDYAPAVGNMMAYVIESTGGFELNAMAATYSPDEEWLFVAGTARSTSYPTAFFFDRISGITSVAPNTTGFLTDPINRNCESMHFNSVGATTLAGIPILYMDNSTLASCDNFGSGGFPSVEAIDRRVIFDGQMMNIIGIRLNDVSYTVTSGCSSPAVSSNLMLPGIIPLQGIDDEYDHVTWPGSAALNTMNNWYYPRFDGNLPATYYDAKRDLNNMYFPHKQFFTYDDNSAPPFTSRHSVIGSYTTAAGNPQEPVVIQTDNDYVENSCASILTLDGRINGTAEVDDGTPTTVSNPVILPNYAVLTLSNPADSPTDIYCGSGVNFKTTPNNDGGTSQLQNEVMVRVVNGQLQWTNNTTDINRIDIFSLNGKQLVSIQGDDLSAGTYIGHSLTKGMYLINLVRQDLSRQSIKWVID